MAKIIKNLQENLWKCLYLYTGKWHFYRKVVSGRWRYVINLLKIGIVLYRYIQKTIFHCKNNGGYIPNIAKKLQKQYILVDFIIRTNCSKSYEKQTLIAKIPGLDKSFALKSCEKRIFWKKSKLPKKLQKVDILITFRTEY